MIVWLLLSRLENGGLERVQFHLAEHFAERGHDVRILAGRILAAPVGPMPPGVSLEEFAGRGRARLLPGLLHALRRDRPRVVLTTSIDLACLVLLLRKLRVGSWRVIVTQHSLASAPRKAAHGLQRLKWEAVRKASRWLVPGADAVIAVSDAVARDLRKELSTSRAIEVIPNPVPARQTDPMDRTAARWPWPDRHIPTVIFVGRLAAEKRLDVLFEAFGLLLARRAARLLLVGAGPLESRVAQWAREQAWGDAFRLVGAVADPLPLIRQSDVLVLPSDHEGFGMVLVEAMACGIQPIAMEGSGGPDEVLAGGRYGALVPRGDPPALARAIEGVISGESRVPAETLRDRAAMFDLQRSASAYERLLDDVARH